LSHIGEVRFTSKSLAKWLKGEMPISGDPVPMVMGLDQVLQALSWSGDLRVATGKVVIVHVVIPPLLSRPLLHFKGRAVGLEMD
jgi:hypothetical protein